MVFGVDAGEYLLAGDRIGIRETAVESVLTVTAAGIAMEIPPEPVDYSEAHYTCDGPAATISTPDGTVILERTGG